MATAHPEPRRSSPSELRDSRLAGMCSRLARAHSTSVWFSTLTSSASAAVLGSGHTGSKKTRTRSGSSQSVVHLVSNECLSPSYVSSLCCCNK